MSYLNDYANAYELGKHDAYHGLPRNNTFNGIEGELYDDGYTEYSAAS